MYDFVRTALAVPKIVVGDVVANTNEIIRMSQVASAKNADIVVFPELSVTGSTCGDLFFQETLQKGVKSALLKLSKTSKDNKNIIIVGAPVLINGGLYNSAVVLAGGKISGIIPKTFPTADGQERWFSSSEVLAEFTINSAEFGFIEDYEIPVGRNLIFDVNNELKFSAEFFEDSKAPLSPSTFLALGGAELLIDISASPETVTSREFEKSLIRQQSANLICANVFVTAGADESTTDGVFSGHSLVAENGNVIAENGKRIATDYILISDIDIGKIKADRIRTKSFKQAGKLYAKGEKTVFVKLPIKELASNGELYNISKTPFVLSDRRQMVKRCENIFRMQISGLQKRLKVTETKAVVGVSGGLDSTLALLVTAKAIKELERPMTDLVGITMPCFGTTDRTYNNSIELMKCLGISIKEINIKEVCQKHFSDIGQDINNHDATYENAQARERMQVLMDYAGRIGGIVVGTGDLSELALGWCTYNGDHMSMYGVNSGIPKTLMREIIKSIVETNVFPEANEVLLDILDTPISPELLPPSSDGGILQKTEDIVGPYELHDFFIYYVLRYGFEPAKIYHIAKRAFKNDYDEKTILKWLESFYKRFFSQQFKRNCVPDGVKIGSIGLSPRGDFKMPSDASVSVWLDQIKRFKV